MQEILKESTFKYLILVGDDFQLKAIELGTWFSFAKTLVPDNSVFELKTNHRTQLTSLRKLWDAVRNDSTDIADILAANNMTDTLNHLECDINDSSQIVLTFQYDGIYGVNNLNTLLQSKNPEDAVLWGLHYYKVGDPVIFNGAGKYWKTLYNNLPGIIRLIHRDDSSITFDVEVPYKLTPTKCDLNNGLKVIQQSNDSTIVRFKVLAYTIDKDVESANKDCVMPLQIAYASTVHKAQSREFDSVKVVITDEIDNRITKDLFYTAITRARKQLIIYWSPETQNRVLHSFQVEKNHDLQIFKARNSFYEKPTRDDNISYPHYQKRFRRKIRLN